MGAVAVIGEAVLIQGFGLAGAVTRVADDAVAVREAWRTLPDDVEVVILTRSAADCLGDAPYAGGRPLVAVME